MFVYVQVFCPYFPVNAADTFHQLNHSCSQVPSCHLYFREQEASQSFFLIVFCSWGLYARDAKLTNDRARGLQAEVC